MVHVKEEKPLYKHNKIVCSAYIGIDRTGCPPIRETAASSMSEGTSMGPSGTPSNTDVSTSPSSCSSSESDQSSFWIRMVYDVTCWQKSAWALSGNRSVSNERKKNQKSMNGISLVESSCSDRQRNSANHGSDSSSKYLIIKEIDKMRNSPVCPKLARRNQEKAFRSKFKGSSQTRTNIAL